MAGSNNLGYCTNKIITSSAVSENVVHCMNTFITSSLAFGCHVGCHRRIFDVGLLFLSMIPPYIQFTAVYSTKTATTPKSQNLKIKQGKNTLDNQNFMELFIIVNIDKIGNDQCRDGECYNARN